MKKYLKRLENDIDINKNWRSILKNKNVNFERRQTLYQIKKTTWSKKPVPKNILYEDEKDNDKYFLDLRTLEGDDFELHMSKEFQIPISTTPL